MKRARLFIVVLPLKHPSVPEEGQNKEKEQRRKIWKGEREEGEKGGRKKEKKTLIKTYKID